MVKPGRAWWLLLLAVTGRLLAATPALVPWPRALTVADGTLTLTPASRIVAGDASLAPLARVLADEIWLSTGLRLATASGTPGPGDLGLALAPTLRPLEQTVTVTDRALAAGGSYAGVAMASASLLQALAVRGETVGLPALALRDEPASAWCGLMLDTARRWCSVDVLKQCVELCRLYKIRWFHLHLTDDQAFTFPSRTYPQLGTHPYWLAGRNGPSPYRREDLLDLVKYADERGVTVVPELEGPGHSGVLQRDLPEVFGVQDPQTGKFRGAGVMNVANPAIYGVLDTLLGELCEVFASSPYIHIGGDESWWPELLKADQVKAYRQRTGLDAGGLHAEYLNKMNALVKAHGKQTICWESFGDKAPVDKDILVMAWGGGHAGLLKRGYRLINVPWTVSVYSTPRQNYDWNLWQVCAEYRPVVQLPRDAGLIGGQMVLWERPGEDALALLRRTAPARNERVYQPDAGRATDEFLERLARTDALLDKLLLPVAVTASGFRPLLGAPADDPPRLFDKSLTVTLAPLVARPGETVRYTLDGREPSATSPAYSAPLTLTERDARRWQPNVNYEPIAEVVLKARLFAGDQPVGFAREAFYHWDWIGAQPKRVDFALWELPGAVKTLPSSSDGLRELCRTREPWVNLRGLPHVKLPPHYLAEWSGGLRVPADGDYEFGLRGIGNRTQWWLDGERVVDRTAQDWECTSAKRTLTAGVHRFTVRCGGEGDFMQALFRPVGQAKWGPPPLAE